MRSALVDLARLIESRRASRRPTPPKTLVNVPLFHVTGEVPVLLNSFVIGRGMVLMPKWDAGEALRLIEKEKITYFVGVPTMSLELMQHPDRDKYDLSLADRHRRRRRRRARSSHVERLRRGVPGAQPALGYGLTETNAVGCSNFWSNYADKPASTGRPHRPFVELAILGAGDSHLPAGERGEIAIRSAANFRGYWRNAEATARRLHRRRLCAHRRHRLSRRRRLSVHRRPQEGHHHPRRREYQPPGSRGRDLRPCRTVAEAAVFGVPDERLGEVPAAVIYSEDGAIDEDGAARLPRRSVSPSSSCRPISGSPTSRCPSSAPARSTGSRCAKPMPRASLHGCSSPHCGRRGSGTEPARPAPAASLHPYLPAARLHPSPRRLRDKAALLGGFARLGFDAAAGGLEGFGDQRSDAGAGGFAIGFAGAVLARGHEDGAAFHPARAGKALEALIDRRRQTERGDVHAQLHCARHLVDVLSARAGGGEEALLQGIFG